MATASIRVTGNDLEDLFTQAQARCNELYGGTREITSLAKVAPNKIEGGAHWFAKAYPTRTGQPPVVGFVPGPDDYLMKDGTWKNIPPSHEDDDITASGDVAGVAFDPTSGGPESAPAGEVYEAADLAAQPSGTVEKAVGDFLNDQGLKSIAFAPDNG